MAKSANPKSKVPEKPKAQFYESINGSRFDDLAVIYGNGEKARLFPYISFDHAYRMDNGEIDIHFTDYLVKVRPLGESFNWRNFLASLQVRSLKEIRDSKEQQSRVSISKKDHENGQLIPL